MATDYNTSSDSSSTMATHALEGVSTFISYPLLDFHLSIICFLYILFTFYRIQKKIKKKGWRKEKTLLWQGGLRQHLFFLILPYFGPLYRKIYHG